MSKVKRRRRIIKKVPKKKVIEDDEFMAAKVGNTDWLQETLEGLYYESAAHHDQNGLDPIHLAALYGRLDCLKYLIEKRKINVDQPSTTGWRPIHLCISNQTGARSYICLKYLLEMGANPSVTNDDGLTPCHQAATQGHLECLQALIDAKATVDEKDKRGHRPIDLAKLWGYRKCSKLLEWEMWNRAKKIEVEERLKAARQKEIDEMLERLRIDDEIDARQNFYGGIAFEQWLNDHKFPLQNTGATHTDKVYAPTKFSGPPLSEVLSSFADYLPPARTLESEVTGATKPAVIKQEKKLETLREIIEKTTDKWNKSTKIPANRTQYVPALSDHYPRDEYTNLPVVPKKATMTAKGTMDYYPKAEDGRPVVFKCKHISDTQKRKLFDYKELPEIGVHFTDDSSSLFFKDCILPEILQKAKISKSKKNSDSYLRDVYNLPEMMNILKRLNKQAQFPKF